MNSISLFFQDNIFYASLYKVKNADYIISSTVWELLHLSIRSSTPPNYVSVVVFRNKSILVLTFTMLAQRVSTKITLHFDCNLMFKQKEWKLLGSCHSLLMPVDGFIQAIWPSIVFDGFSMLILEILVNHIK